MTENALGGLCLLQGGYERAHRHLRRALDLYQELGDRVGECHVLDNLGVVYERQRDYEQAREQLQRALRLLGRLGPATAAWKKSLPGPSGSCVPAAAWAHHELGHIELAREHASQAVTLHASRGVYDASETRGFLASLG